MTQELKEYLKQELVSYAEARRQLRNLPKQDKEDLITWEWIELPNSRKFPKKVFKYKWIQRCSYPYDANYITAVHNIYNLVRNKAYRHKPGENKISSYGDSLDSLLVDLRDKHNLELNKEELASVQF